MLFFFSKSLGQTSNSSGDWNTGSNWSGGSVPSGWTTINVGHTMNSATNWNVSGTLNINSGGDVTFDGDVIITGGSTINVYGTLRITGKATLNSTLNIFPGGSVIVETDVDVVNSSNLKIGDGSAVPPYADLIIKGDLISSNSGDILVNSDGRVAVYGDFSGGGSGGTLLTLEDGGQMIVIGDMLFTGGGDQINNKNTDAAYFGLYVGGSNGVQFTGGGSGFVGGEGQGTQSGSNSGYAHLDDIDTDNPDLAAWAGILEDSPLPVSLISYKVAYVSDKVIMTWFTASEINNEVFIIYRSSDNVSYEEIGSVSGHGNSTEILNYSFSDIPSTSGTYYYKLKQVDFDGQFEVLGIRSVEFVDSSFSLNTLAVYPSPAKANQDIYVSAIVSSAILYDISGRSQTELDIVTESNRSKLLTFNVNLMSGSYILKVLVGNELVMRRIDLY